MFRDFVILVSSRIFYIRARFIQLLYQTTITKKKNLNCRTILGGCEWIALTLVPVTGLPLQLHSRILSIFFLYKYRSNSDYGHYCIIFDCIFSSLQISDWEAKILDLQNMGSTAEEKPQIPLLTPYQMGNFQLSHRYFIHLSVIPTYFNLNHFIWGLLKYWKVWCLRKPIWFSCIFIIAFINVVDSFVCFT